MSLYRRPYIVESLNNNKVAQLHRLTRTAIPLNEDLSSMKVDRQFCFSFAVFWYETCSESAREICP